MQYTHSQLLKLIESGIPVETARFQSAVNNGRDIPENQFSIKSENASRRAEMWLTPINILIFKSYGRLDFTTLPNVIGGSFKPDEAVEAKQEHVAKIATTEPVTIIKKRGRPFSKPQERTE